MTIYTVTAESRVRDQPSVDFLVEAPKAKDAWTAARKVTKDGGNVKSGDAEITVAANAYTVRTVFSTERKAAKSKALTVDALVEAANAEGVPLSKKLTDLIDRLRGTPAQQQAA